MAPAGNSRAKSNPIPFRERLSAGKRETCHYTGWGLRKLNKMLAEGSVDSVVIGHRRYVVVESLLRVLEAGKNVVLSEPWQLAKAKTESRVARNTSDADARLPKSLTGTRWVEDESSPSKPPEGEGPLELFGRGNRATVRDPQKHR